jgi:mRNA interferase YafQ
MRTLVYTTQFRKDYRKFLHKPKHLEALNTILRKLEKGEPIPPDRHPHKLHGIYEGCMECHVLSDFLLIWIDEKTDTVWLQRLGSHHELFGI